jgi:proline iminopeptidase
MNNYYNKYLKYKYKYISLKNGGYPTLFHNLNQSNYLNVDDIHTIYYEESGNPQGIPIIWIHGGPGGGLNKNYTKLFDYSQMRIIGYEQRGSGRSIPFGSLENNTTEHLIDDLEKLRKHLKIDKWIIIGNSWGSTLSLLYAIKHSEKILGIIIGGVCLLRQSELDWLYKKGGVSNIYPEEWEIFENHIPLEERNDMIAAYYKRLTSTNEKIKNDACYNWCQLELKIATFTNNELYKTELNKLKRIIKYSVSNDIYCLSYDFIITSILSYLEH